MSPDERLAPSIYTGGHSFGYQCVLVNCSDQKIILGSFDLFLLEVIKKKKEILAITEEEN